MPPPAPSFYKNLTHPPHTKEIANTNTLLLFLPTSIHIIVLSKMQLKTKALKEIHAGINTVFPLLYCS